MGRQRNMPQMKEQENFPEELNEMEVTKIIDAGLKQWLYGCSRTVGEECMISGRT